MLFFFPDSTPFSKKKKKLFYNLIVGNGGFERWLSQLETSGLLTSWTTRLLTTFSQLNQADYDQEKLYEVHSAKLQAHL